MYIEVPSGDSHSRVLLQDVLFSPIMGITLVSIGQITSAGSNVLFHGDTCRIYNASKILLAQIPKRGGLYQNYSPCAEQTGYAGKVKEILTINELHQKLGHIGHEYARQLVRKGMVTGVELDEDSKPSFCESCEWGKKHRKPIQGVREEPKSSAVGDEIHSDLWGKAPTRTINGKEYSVSFTDGYACYDLVTFPVTLSVILSLLSIMLCLCICTMVRLSSWTLAFLCLLCLRTSISFFIVLYDSRRYLVIRRTDH